MHAWLKISESRLGARSLSIKGIFQAPTHRVYDVEVVVWEGCETSQETGIYQTYVVRGRILLRSLKIVIRARQFLLLGCDDALRI